MDSIRHLNVATETLSSQINAEAKRTTHEATTKEQLAQSHFKRDEVLGLLDIAIAQVAKASGELPSNAASSIPLRDQPSQSSVSGGTQQFMSTNAGATLLANSSTGTPEDAARELVDQVSGIKASQLSIQNSQLAQMASSAKPIMDNFKKILEKPFLGNYSATLNTAPVVGLKGRTIWYIDTKADISSSRTATQDVWSVFSDIPIQADLNLGNVHLFPYQGDMYLAVGKAVWFKRHRARDDPQVKQESLRRWSKLFHDDWESLGSDCLPTSDLLDVIPHARLSADHDAMRFRLLVLASDGSLKVFSGGKLSSSNQFDDLPFDQGTDVGVTLPKWMRIAYHNDLVIGYDDNNNTWNIIPDFDKCSYGISKRSHEQHFTEFTATDAGLVVAKEDGFLYKRLVENVANPDKPDETTTAWIRWINQDGVKTLGVASPGVMLDLRSLTQSLRTRYVETQASFWSIVFQIKAFAMTHEIRLHRLLNAADQLSSADTVEKEKRELKTGIESVRQGQTWAKILGRICADAEKSVTLMSKQMTEVGTDLKVQLHLLHDKLRSLREQLAVQKDALSKAMVGFWIENATTLIGLIGVVSGLVIANPWVVTGAGALFVGGIINTATYGNKASQAQAAIDRLNIEMNDIIQAHEEMSQLITSFGMINGVYEQLLDFWGRMSGNADKVKGLDNATMIEIGYKVLQSNAPEIEASLKLMTEMQVAAQAWMDLIASQGIMPVPSFEDDDDAEIP